MPLPGFRLAQLVAANGAQPQAPLNQPMPQVVVASAAPVPAPVPANLACSPPLRRQCPGRAEPGATPAYPSQDVIGAWLSDTYNLGAPPAALGQTAPSAPLGYVPAAPSEGQPVDR